MSRGRLYRIKVDQLPASACRPDAVFEYQEVQPAWAESARSGIHSMEKVQYERNAVKVKYYTAKGADVFIAMDKEVFELIDFVFNEERSLLMNKALEYNQQREDLELKIRRDKLAFMALPWYKRVWRALMKNV